MATSTVQIVIDSLVAAGVKYIFGVPGAKIDSVFDALLDHPELRLVVCRHEQNAAFIAGAFGRLTGRPGVCIATSGPGTSNLVTGLVTATDEGAPMVAIVGSVKRSQALKKTHQSLRGVELLGPVTKQVAAAVVEDQVAEIMLSAFRVAAAHPQGATAVSLPIDIMTAGVSKSSIPAFPASAFLLPSYGPASVESLQQAAARIRAAKAPVLFLGMRASDPEVVKAVHAFLAKHPIPVVETFQAAGSLSRELVHLFFGRVGLFRNQPGDRLLTLSDLVITVGYEQSEYDANQWNEGRRPEIIHVDVTPADSGYYYQPKLELVGSIAKTIAALTDIAAPVGRLQDTDDARAIFTDFHAWEDSPDAEGKPSGPVHPLHFIRLLRRLLPAPDTVVACDVGSVYIWLSRYFFSYAPRTFLTSNAQQTLGVALPWAVGASLAQAAADGDGGVRKKVVSVSGDGGFLFSGQELVTAVQQGCDLTHFVWNDGRYNMVEFQEVQKYGRSAGVELGGVDFVKYAEAMGAKGLRAASSAELEGVMREALAWRGVCVVDIDIDYSQNHELMAHVISDKMP